MARTYVHLFLIIAIGPVRKCVTVECGVTTLTLVKNEWKSIVSKRLRERTHTRNLSQGSRMEEQLSVRRAK